MTEIDINNDEEVLKSVAMHLLPLWALAVLLSLHGCFMAARAITLRKNTSDPK